MYLFICVYPWCYVAMYEIICSWFLSFPIFFYKLIATWFWLLDFNRLSLSFTPEVLHTHFRYSWTNASVNLCIYLLIYPSICHIYLSKYIFFNPHYTHSERMCDSSFREHFLYSCVCPQDLLNISVRRTTSDRRVDQAYWCVKKECID